MLLWEELQDAPPVRMLVAAFVGYKRPKKKNTEPLFAGGSAKTSDFMQVQTLGSFGKMPPSFKESIEWAEQQKKLMGL